MNMTTRTQLQTHFGRLRDLASQPSQPLKPSFWDNLNVDSRKASVNLERSWEFNNESAWDPIGSVKDEWNDYIYPRTIKPLLQHNTNKIYHGVKKQTPYSVCCWMIGKEWDSSHPAAIIICGNKKVTKNAVKLIERHGELIRTWGFQVYGYESKISLTMGASSSELDEGSTLCAISGTRFAVGGGDGISTRTATLGGSIMINGEFFGLTVAHPFMNISQDESSDDDESDMSDDESDFSDNIGYADTTELATVESVMLKSNVAVVEDPISHQRTILGSIPDQSYFSHTADWALLKLEPAALAINLLALGDKLAIPWWVQPHPPNGELWVGVNPLESVQTKASPSICGLFVPSSGMQDVWAMSLKPTPGYCGSWVMDATTEGIFGIIVAGSEANDVSYGLPACNIFDQIRARFPSMKLQSLSDMATLPVQHFVHFIRQAKELGLAQFARKVVSMPSQLDKQDSSGYNALCWAIREGDETAVASLLEVGVNPDGIGARFEMRPLALAVQKGHVAMVKLILASGADPNPLSGDYRTPLLAFAAEPGHRELTRILIARGSKVNTRNGVSGRSPLAVAAQYGDEEVIRILISSGATVDAKDIRGRTPLMDAVISHKEKATRVLLQNGANVNCIDNDGRTPLFFAAGQGHRELTRLLIARNSDVDICDTMGRSPLAVAAQYGDEGVIRILISSGAPVNAKDLSGRTPLMDAVISHKEKATRVLLQNGANFNCIDNDGRTPLFFAAKIDDPTFARLLLEWGATQVGRPQNGDTPLIIAAMNGHDQVVEALLEQQEYPDVSNNEGDTPLMIAVTQGHNSTVEILLRHGANIYMVNKSGDTPWTLARKDKHMTHFLLEYHSSSQNYKGKSRPLTDHLEPRSDISPTNQPSEIPNLSESDLSESAQEKKQKEKKRFEESMRNMDEFMAEPDTESHRERQ